MQGQNFALERAKKPTAKGGEAELRYLCSRMTAQFSIPQERIPAGTASSFLVANFPDTDIPEPHKTGEIVQLQPDGAGGWAAWIAGVLRHQLPVYLHRDAVFPTLNLDVIPVQALLRGCGGRY